MKINRVKFFTCNFALFIFVMISGCGNSTKEKNTISRETMMEKDTPFKSGYADVNGIKMYYEMHGTGTPLVLIHGGGSTINTTFGKILPLFAKTHQVIAVELQAHGRTSDRDTASSFQQDADDVAALLTHLKIDAADILGFSNGGNTAMQIAIRHPEKVKKLVVISSFYKREGMPEGFWQSMEKATFDDMPQLFKDEFLKVNNDQAGLHAMFNRDAVRMRTFKDWNDIDLKSISVPTLLMTGDKDVVSPEHAVAMSHLIPHCELAIIPGGHGKLLGEIITLSDGKWTQEYAKDLIEEFLQNTK